MKDNNIKTIEGFIFRALSEANLISPSNKEDIRKNGWKRAARTDKGVHAILNTLNVKLDISNEYIDINIP